MTITLRDIANKFDAHLIDVKDFESTIAEAMYIPFINKKAMALPADVERKARVITYQVFKRRYEKSKVVDGSKRDAYHMGWNNE